jgi:hypothetical protein
LRTAVGVGNREILNIRSRIVFLAHASYNGLCADHERAIAWPGDKDFNGGRATGTFRGNVGRPFRGSQVAGFRTATASRIITAENKLRLREPHNDNRDRHPRIGGPYVAQN